MSGAPFEVPINTTIPEKPRITRPRRKKMKKSITILLTVMVLFALKTQSEVLEPLKLIQSIPMPGLHDGDFDHFALDLQGQRLFLAAEDNSAVEVLDLRANKLIHTITD